MPLRPLIQSSFFDPEFVSPGCLVEGTTAWLLARRRSSLFPSWLFSGWRGEGGGRNAWPAVVLMTLVVLRWTQEGMSRRASVERARTDMAWRAALGIALDGAVPSERTLRDFERFLRKRHPEAGQPRYLLFHEHVVRLCLEKVDKKASTWAMDSTPMWCYGACLDTVRLLGDGLRAVGRRFAQGTKQTLEQVTGQWKLPVLLGKSTKGALAIDWRDPAARTAALSGLAEDVLRIAEQVRADIHRVRHSLRRSLLRLCRRLVGVVHDDFETDPEGRLVIARRVAQDRLVSLTDPQARHGRKSASQTFKGFKLHVLGDVVSGLIASVTVTAGNQHENSVAHRLIRRAKVLYEDLDRVLGDTAYGGAELRCDVQALGVHLLAPPQPVTAPEGRFSKNDFMLDFEEDAATCPAGVTSTHYTTPPSLKGGKRFTWSSADCQHCPLAGQCLMHNTKSRALILHPHEQTLQAIREEWSRPETRKAYRVRTQCERLVNHLTRHGARQARAWGQGSAHFQVHTIAVAVNLALLARMVAEEQDQSVRAAA